MSGTTITASAQNTDLALANPNGFIVTGDGSLLLDAGATTYQVTVNPALSNKPVLTALPYGSSVVTYTSRAIGSAGTFVTTSQLNNAQEVTSQAYTSLVTFLGTANETVTTGQPVKVAVTGGGGIATGLSGLTTTTRYAYTNTGAVVPQGTSTAVANAGLAISATTLLQI